MIKRYFQALSQFDKIKLISVGRVSDKKLNLSTLVASIKWIVGGVMTLVLILNATLFANTNFVKDVKIGAYLNNSFYYFNNGDLRALDNRSVTTVENTDDAVGIVYSRVGVEIGLNVYETIDFYLNAYKPFFWGNDSAEYNSEGNSIFLKEANMNIGLYRYEKISYLDLKVGRQFYSINTTRFKNFVLKDILDALIVKFGYSIFGFELGFDFFSMNSPAEGVYILKDDRHPYTVRYFDGDVNTYKLFTTLSLSLSNDFIKDSLSKVYFIFARIGAMGESPNQGGWEITRGGAEGNFADNDFALVGGLSSYFDFELVSFMVEFALSYGIDRKHRTFPNVETFGFLGYLGVEFVSDVFKAGLDGLYVSSANTDRNGNYINYGFISMKGDRVGGMLFSKYYGNYPSAIVNYQGIVFKPFGLHRSSPTAMGSAKVGIEDLNILSFSKDPNSNGLGLMVEFYAYLDTSQSSANLNASGLRIDVYDQKRFGKFMATELNVIGKYKFYNGSMETGINFGWLLPFDFYSIPVSIPKAPYGLYDFIGFEVFLNTRI
ncbi:MAG: hypothetical protein RMJ37_06515 [Spirochaetia bacterium]|nr:hypothetical protein [Spirochaetota bacterium]MCX8096274.1 hypothetical protein [Spirochaetota bacterium]MDW8112967.1 hypothetical protein [Spirochaetia bacterium]